MMKLQTLFLCVITINIAFGQDIELFGVEYARYPGSAIKTADSLEASFTEYEVAALFPAIRKEKFSLLAGGTYRLVVPDGDAIANESNLFFLSLNLIGIYNVSEKGKLILNAIPAASTSTDSRGITSDNFLMQGALLYRRQVSKKFTYNLGVVSTSRFGSPLIVPLVGLSHQGEKMKLHINLPLLMQAMWNYQADFSYGLKLAVNGSQYNFDDQLFNGNEVDLARFSRVRIGPEVQYRIKGPLVLTAFGGIAANRTYDFELDGANDLDFSLDNGPFVSFRLSIKPQPKNN